MRLPRRMFLKSSGIALVGFGSVLGGLPRCLARAAEETTARGKVLVVVFQRGAADGLNIVVPHAEPAYYRLRPSIAIPRPVAGAEGAALDLDGSFGLHPSLAPLLGLYRRKLLAVIHAAGSPDATRSHFDAQDFMETGTPGVKRTQDGWLNRYLQQRADRAATGLRAVSLTSHMPRILGGRAPALAIPDLSGFGFAGRRAAAALQRGLLELYGASADPLLTPTAREAFEALEQVERIDARGYRPANAARYPPGRFGRDLMQVAQLIKAGVGLEIAFTEVGGWDHHVNQGGSRGALANLLRQFGAGIGAFVDDLGDRIGDVVLVTLSEFGRTAAENGNRGTDHGHANAMFVVGGGIVGGKCYGAWPGLEREQLNEGRDLALTSDFRDVLGELLIGHLSAKRIDHVFPGHLPAVDRSVGLFGRRPPA